MRGIGRGPNGVLLIKGVLAGVPWGRSFPLSLSPSFIPPRSFRPSRRACLLLQQEMSLLGDDEGAG